MNSELNGYSNNINSLTGLSNVYSPEIVINDNLSVNNISSVTYESIIPRQNILLLENLTSNVQTQITNSKNNITALETKTANFTSTGSTTTLFSGTLTLNCNTTLVTNKTMTVNGSFSFGANGTIISNSVTLTNIQIGYLQATSPIQTQFNALQFKTTNQTYNSTLNRTAISGICLLENLNLSGTINSRQINVGTDVSPSLIQLFGDLTIPLNSTITANGIVLTATEISFLDSCSSNIQNQLDSKASQANLDTTNSNITTNTNTLSDHTTRLDDLDDDISDHTTRLDDLDDDISNLQTDVGDSQDKILAIELGFGFDSALAGGITLGEWIVDFLRILQMKHDLSHLRHQMMHKMIK